MRETSKQVTFVDAAGTGFHCRAVSAAAHTHRITTAIDGWEE
ncbi:hypothetical protein [Nocardia otitidiscaviarum]|nr:hypothetical protein [Nocardia otitidiscaviarum]